MFVIRPVEPADFPKVYEFTLKLLQHHIGQCEKSLIKPEELSDLFRDGFLHGLILSYSPGIDKENEIIGVMLFHPDVSPLHGGYGVYLDQFYIEPDFRKRGLGSIMMSKLCQRVMASGGRYIKLVYQDGLGLEPIYSKMGFVNFSKGHSEIHLFEAYGKSKLQEFITLNEEYNDHNGEKACGTRFLCKCRFSEPIVLVHPYSHGYIGDQSPTWKRLSHASSSNLSTDDVENHPPSARMVMIAESPSQDPKSLIDVPQPGSKFCMFIEQYSVCGWLGPMVNFSEFIGDTSILRREIFINRVHAWLEICPRISGIVWEVPTKELVSCCSDEGFDSAKRCNNVLSSMLHQSNIPDDTSQEGWNIVYLDHNAMTQLIESQKSCSCPVKV